MTTKNVSITLLHPSKVSDVNEFYNSIYHTSRTDDEFRWEFYSAPAGNAIYIIAVDDDTQKVVGIQSAIPITLITSDQQTVSSAKSEDTLVHPDYRGLKIFERMYELLFEECIKVGIEYIWGFTNAKKPFIRLGFAIPYEHSQSLLVLKTMPSFRYLSSLNEQNNLVSTTKIFGLSLLGRMRAIRLKKKHVQLSEYDVSIIDSKSSIHAALPKSSIGNGFTIQQDATYIDWRIKDNPYHQVVFQVVYKSGDEIVGNSYFNLHKDGVWYLIDDKYARSVSTEKRSILLNNSINLLLQHHTVGLIRTWDFTHNQVGLEEIDVRMNCGFYHLDRGMAFVWKPLFESSTLNPNDFILTRLASQGVI